MRRAAVLIVCAVVACSPPGGGGSTSAASPSPVAPSPARALSAGGIVEYPIPKPPKTPSDCGPRCPAAIADLALGPDGNIWFEDNNRKVIGRITPTGDVKQFSEAYELIGGANTIVAGPDGNVWVVAGGGGRGKPDWILRVTPAGQITPFSAGDNLGGGLGSGPESITLGPDGNLWFDEFWTNRIGRLTPSGSLTEFAIPTADSGPRGITAGP